MVLHTTEAIQWDEGLSTGVEMIDNQHKEIITRINVVFYESEGDVSDEEIDGLVRFVGGYVIDHFNAEEEYMIKYKYHDYDHHKSQHMQFLKNFAILKRFLEKEKSPSLILQAINNQAVDWLISHIKKEDMKMAEFLRARM